MYRIERLPYNKYKAKSTVYNNISYASKLEANYAMELDLRVKAKDIKSWDRQIKIEINFKKVGSEWVLTGEEGLDLKSKSIEFRHFRNYYIDFVIYHNDDSVEYVETKGMETEVWRMKWFLTEMIFCDDPVITLTVVK